MASKSSEVVVQAVVVAVLELCKGDDDSLDLGVVGKSIFAELTTDA